MKRREEKEKEDERSLQFPERESLGQRGGDEDDEE